MKHFSRVLCLLLVFGMLALAMTSCDNGNASSSGKDKDDRNPFFGNNGSENTAESGSNPFFGKDDSDDVLSSDGNDGSDEVSSSVGEGAGQTSSNGNDGFRLEKKNFNGTTIKILTDRANDFYQWEVAPQELISGDRINNAFYNRAQLIEANYGIHLEQYFAESQDDVVQRIRENYIVWLDEFQAYAAGMTYLSRVVPDGLLLDLSSIESNHYMDLSQPYWDQSSVRDLTILGGTYFATGDALITDDDATWAIFFNKDIAENGRIAEKYGVDSLYDLVRENKWTLDVMYEIMQDVTTDAGDSGMTWGKDTPDTWGLIAQCYDAYTFTVGAGQTLMRNDGTNIVVTAGDPGNINAFDKVFTMLTDSGHVAIAETTGRGSSDCYGDMIPMFANGKGLFMSNRISSIYDPTLRDANIRYGLLPMPKADEQQEYYTSTVTVYWCSALAIPITNIEKLDATCYALEALAYYGMEQVTPEYYDHVLKCGRFEDTDSLEMLDLIFRSRTYDIGAVFNIGNSLGFYTTRLLEGLSGYENQHASALESVRDVWEVAIEDLLLQVQASRE